MEQSGMNSQGAATGMQGGVQNVAVGAETAQPIQPTVTPTPPVAPESELVMPMKKDSEKKQNQGMLVGLIICIILALGGVGFGIWAMVDGNTKVDKLNTEVTSLKNENADLEQQVANLGGVSNAMPEAKEWKSTEVRDGVFYILDAAGETVAKSEASWPAISEATSCEASAENTLLTCTVNTAEGEAKLIYDAIGNSFGLVTEPNE